MEDQKEMQTRLVPGVGRLPYPSYRGKGPYVFISYAHDDKDRVFREIRRFNEAGFHVWYDEGIAPGNEWSDEIAAALSNCSVFVVMLTPVSAPREAVLNEISFALDEGKPVLAIYLEDTKLPPGLRLRISRKQAILKYNMTDEEYEFKYTEAFMRFGLRREETIPPAAEAFLRAAPSVPSSPPAAEAVQTNASAVPAAGKHPFGDYVPKGTAVITDGLGREFTAIDNSLVYKPVGAIRFQTLHDLSSMERTPNGYVLWDFSGRETLLKTSPGDELMYLGEQENRGLGMLNPERIQINMVKSIRIDSGRTPDRKIRYCDIRMKDGSFLSPLQFLFFAVNEKEGAPPVMKLGKDLNKYSKSGHAGLLMMKKLTVIKAGEAAGPYGNLCSLDVAVEYPGNDTESFTIDGYFAVYAMGAGGEMHQLKQEELTEIEIL